MTESEKVGRKIKELRKKKGYTQQELSSKIIVSQSYLRRIEHGGANPTVNMVARILAFLEERPNAE